MSLTLRTPTLDDVFLQLTGSHLQGDGSDHVDGEHSDNGQADNAWADGDQADNAQADGRRSDDHRGDPDATPDTTARPAGPAVAGTSAPGVPS